MTHEELTERQAITRGKEMYIVKSKSRYINVKNGDGSPFTDCLWTAEIFRSTRKADATAFSSLSQAFEVKAWICNSCAVHRAYWPHQIVVINVETGEEIQGYSEWKAEQLEQLAEAQEQERAEALAEDKAEELEQERQQELAEAQEQEREAA